MIHVRSVEKGDGKHLMEATRTLARFHGWEDTVTATPESFELAMFKKDPLIGAFLAFEGQNFAGSIVWHRSFSTNQGCEVIYLEDLIVMPDQRRKGVADALIKTLAKWAVTHSYPSIFWVMMNWNAEAKAFYQKIGAEAEVDCSVYALRADALLELAK